MGTTQDRCTLKRLQKTIKLSVNATGLYLLDVSEFCIQPIDEAASQFHDFVGLIHHHVGDKPDKSRGITNHDSPSRRFSFFNNRQAKLPSADISCRGVPTKMPIKPVARQRSIDDPTAPETCSDRSTGLESHAIQSERDRSVQALKNLPLWS